MASFASDENTLAASNKQRRPSSELIQNIPVTGSSKAALDALRLKHAAAVEAETQSGAPEAPAPWKSPYVTENTERRPSRDGRRSSDEIVQDVSITGFSIKELEALRIKRGQALDEEYGSNDTRSRRSSDNDPKERRPSRSAEAVIADVSVMGTNSVAQLDKLRRARANSLEQAPATVAPIAATVRSDGGVNSASGVSAFSAEKRASLRPNEKAATEPVAPHISVMGSNSKTALDGLQRQRTKSMEKRPLE